MTNPVPSGLGRWVNIPALLAVIFWGSTYVVIKVIMMDGLSPLSLAVLRVGFGAVLLFGALMITEKDWGVAVKDLPVLALLGLTGLAIFQIFFTVSLKYITASTASVLVSISPLIVAIVVILTRFDVLRWRTVAGILVAFGGVALVAQREEFSFGNEALVGDIFCLVSAVGWGIYVAIQIPLLRRYSTTKVMAYAAGFGTIFILPFTAGDLLTQDWGRISLPGWGLIVYYVVISGYVATVLWSRGIRNWGPARTSAYSYLNPIFGIVSGMIFLGEAMVPIQLVGTVAVFVGLALARR
ncbi:MAG: EamA family transporter [Dehalococcoidia bacterium]|nr:EamA family transporter [Dehalococcoidia bacterium]